MADDLEDEWWLSKEEQSEKDANKEHEYESVELTHHGKTKNDGNKKSTKHVLAQPHEDGDEPVVKKKKRRKKKKREEQENIEEKAGIWEDIVASLREHFTGKIPMVQIEDLLLSEVNFLPNNECLNDLSTYLSFSIRKWKKLSKADDLKPKSPTILVITSAAKRAVDLNREAKDFKGICTSAKLFAKHMKIKEQVKLLSENKVQFAVGTPNRITSLIELDALDLTGVRYIILDWNFRDLKKRRMIDIPETKSDLFNLFKDNVVPTILQGAKLKVGLF